jgi:hypothetical protein
MMRRTATRLALLLLVLPLVACSSEEKKPDAAPSPSASATATPSTPAIPRAGECHQLTAAQATEPVAAGRTVPCSDPHTAVTTKVGRLSLLADGHLLAIDSKTVRTQIADACPGTAALLGGDRTTQRLSRFEVVWFSPSLEEADAGADWYRCDVVAVKAQDKLLPLPPRLKGVLDRSGALDRYGTCGTAAPDKRNFKRVLCSDKHSWRAVDVVDLPADARYLAKDVAALGNSRCKDIASDRAGGALEFTWSFEWPTRAQWQSGQRYGYCWVPDEG